MRTVARAGGAFVVGLALLGSGLVRAAAAADGPQESSSSPAPAAAAGGGEPACHEAPVRPRYDVSDARYEVPNVTLLDASGRPVGMRSLLAADEPLALNFIFTTCTTICPVMTATFAQLQRELGAQAPRVRLVSISIDPSQDRPAVLREYARRYGAGQGWTFLTGDSADVERLLRALGAYTGSKTNHRPLTLLKRADAVGWVRIDGLASGADLAGEVRRRLLD